MQTQNREFRQLNTNEIAIINKAVLKKKLPITSPLTNYNNCLVSYEFM